MAKKPNVFTLLDSYTDKSIDTVEQLPFFIKNSKAIAKYPLSLGEVRGGIPFTLFMPYKRPSLLKGIRAIQTTDAVITSLPTPDFAIALPTPPSALKTTYAATYDDVNLGQAGGMILSELDLATNSAKEITDKLLEVGGGALVGGMIGKLVGGNKGTVAGVLAGLGAGVMGAENAAKQAGVSIAQVIAEKIGIDEEAVNLIIGEATNPFTDQMFKNVGFRTHNFNYTFLPKSKEDSESIDEIIQLFKYAMLPRPSSTTGFFEFPYEFQITHSIQATTFTLLPSVLESLETDFGGGTDSLKLFKTTSGGKQYPTKITVSMTFKEMVLLNRDRITGFRKKGYFVSDDGVAPPDDATVKRYRF